MPRSCQRKAKRNRVPRVLPVRVKVYDNIRFEPLTPPCPPKKWSAATCLGQTASGQVGLNNQFQLTNLKGYFFAPWANSEKSPCPCEDVAGRRLATPLKLHGSCPCLDVSANLPPEDRGPQAGDVQQERWLKVQRRVCWCSSVWGSGFNVSGLCVQGFEV